jgi:hypothetical protein
MVRRVPDPERGPGDAATLSLVTSPAGPIPLESLLALAVRSPFPETALLMSEDR